MEVFKGTLYKHTTNDPRNNEEQIRPWDLKNRINYRKMEDLGPTPMKDGHFVDEDVYFKVLEKLSKKGVSNGITPPHKETKKSD